MASPGSSSSGPPPEEESPAGGGDDVVQLTAALKREKAAKRKMYFYLVKIADELKTLRADADQRLQAAEYAPKAWYEGGMWRGPNVLQSAAAGIAGAASSPAPPGGGGAGDDDYGSGHDGGGAAAGAAAATAPPVLPSRAPVSLLDLFLDIVTVTAFARVGAAIQDRGALGLPALAYFCIFHQIWSKEASYSTRFDTTDISSHLETLLACFALLGGSLSAAADWADAGCTRIMGVALLVAGLHVALHARVWYWFRRGEGEPDSVNDAVRQYAVFIAAMNGLEALNWAVGIYLPHESAGRPWIFLVGILLNLRSPRGIMPNDFHAACSKRGVLFILLLGFNLQSVVGVASTYFNYWDPSWNQYAFLFLACFLLFMIKLLYVDDTNSIAPQDHALLYHRAAGCCFHLGNFALLFATTVLGSGLNLLTSSFLAAAAALGTDATTLVCGGFSAVVFSIGFIKSTHIRRVPSDPQHERLFLYAYLTQLACFAAVVLVTARMCRAPPSSDHGFLALLMRNEIEMLAVLVFFAVALILVSWLDEAVELHLYRDAAEAGARRVRPFGFWARLAGAEPREVEALARERARASVMSLSGSMFHSIANLSKEDV